MITISLFLTEAFATNLKFDPTLLYVGTFILDFALFSVIADFAPK